MFVRCGAQEEAAKLRPGHALCQICTIHSSHGGGCASDYFGGASWGTPYEFAERHLVRWRAVTASCLCVAALSFLQEPLAEEVAPEQAYPEQAYPEQAYPEQAYPEQAYPEEAPPEEAAGSWD